MGLEPKSRVVTAAHLRDGKSGAAYSGRLNLLLAGPPASGKSTRALTLFRETPGSFLVTPTATMAEHLRLELARATSPVRPSRVGTLASFLDTWLHGWGMPPAAPKSLLHILIAQGLEELRPARFEHTREFPGLHAELAKLLEEIGDPRQCGPGLAELFGWVEARLASRGFALRDQRLRAAAAKVRASEATPPRHTIFDGFFTLAPSEVEFIASLAQRGSVMVTLPEPDHRLAAAGFRVEHMERSLRSPERVVFAADTPEREAEEIARRILEHAARGRRFREMGVVLRSRDPYGPLSRGLRWRDSGIPARTYFQDSQQD